MADRDCERILAEQEPELVEIMPYFMDCRRGDLTMIHEQLRQGDFAGLRIIGHNLKGTGASFGFDAVSEIGVRLEQGAAARSVDEIAACAAELADYLARIEACLA
jgi:HPt (histidine-containing phosphotransfer) domain-containing protein